MRLFLSILIAGVLQQVNPGASFQSSVDSSPLKTVELFKKGIDANDMLSVVKLMADEEGAGPLAQAKYEQMQRSLEGLSSMWRPATFTYGEVTYTDQSKTSATVKVEIKNLSQEAKFALLKFGTAWYIFDIEIYFK
ncbi:MAG: hypothetical protein L0Y80_05515 [Ignavibacteriae bacterium]|nr:hypothetical protein [Ignavibacteriota bacterium]